MFGRTVQVDGFEAIEINCSPSTTLVEVLKMAIAAAELRQQTDRTQTGSGRTISINIPHI